MTSESLDEAFAPILAEFLATPGMARLSDGGVGVLEYRSFLKQTYYYVRENPQLQALATVYFRGRERDLVKAFYDHAGSEVGHEQLALNDFVTLGGSAEDVPYKNPLPATTALTSFAFHQIYNRNPIGYLGYLYFLEFLPTMSGPVIAEALVKGGVPTNAMSFLQDHIEIDQAHNRLMKRYAEILVTTQETMDCVKYAMKTTSYLYSQMVAAAIDDAHTQADMGWDWEELRADGKTPADAAAVA